jgi:hypothetical protein
VIRCTFSAASAKLFPVSFAGAKRHPMRLSFLAALALGVCVACVFPTSVCGCSPIEPAGIIFGSIGTSDAGPLRGGLVRTYQLRGPCPGRGEAFTGGFGDVRTDSGGRYRTFVSGDVDSVCVRVVAYRSVATRTDSLISTPTTVAIRIAPPFDSTRIDLRFP